MLEFNRSEKVSRIAVFSYFTTFSSGGVDPMTIWSWCVERAEERMYVAGYNIEFAVGVDGLPN